MKILVAYATRAGSTAEIAEAVARRLARAGQEARAEPVRTVFDLQPDQAVVLGSAVRYGRWLPEMTAFVLRHRQQWAGRPTALFTVAMSAPRDGAAEPGALAALQRITQAARQLTAARTEAFFAGQVDPKTLSLLERLIVRVARSPVGDRRDWPAIERWADTLPRALAGPAPEP